MGDYDKYLCQYCDSASPCFFEVPNGGDPPIVCPLNNCSFKSCSLKKEIAASWILIPEDKETTIPVLHAPSAHSVVECLKELKFGRPARQQLVIDELINIAVSRLGDDGPPFSPDIVDDVFNKGEEV